MSQYHPILIEIYDTQNGGAGRFDNLSPEEKVGAYRRLVQAMRDLERDFSNESFEASAKFLQSVPEHNER